MPGNFEKIEGEFSEEKGKSLASKPFRKLQTSMKGKGFDTVEEVKQKSLEDIKNIR